MRVASRQPKACLYAKPDGTMTHSFLLGSRISQKETVTSTAPKAISRSFSSHSRIRDTCQSYDWARCECCYRDVCLAKQVLHPRNAVGSVYVDACPLCNLPCHVYNFEQPLYKVHACSKFSVNSLSARQAATTVGSVVFERGLRTAVLRYLDEHFADERGPEEVPKRHEEVAAANATEVKGSIGPSSQQQDTVKAMPAQHTHICVESQRQQQMSQRSKAPSGRAASSRIP